MRYRGIVSLQVVLLFSLVMIATSSLRASDRDVELFLRTYRSASDELAKLCSQMEMECQSESQLPANTSKVSPPRVRFALDGPNSIFLRIYERPYHIERLILRTEGSSYDLRRKTDSGPYYIGETPVAKAQLGVLDYEIRSIPLAPISMGRGKLHEIVKHPSFKITQLERDGDLFTATFDHASQDKSKASVRTYGTFTVDSKRKYVITAYELRMDVQLRPVPVKVHEKAVIKYTTNMGLPMLSEITVVPVSEKEGPKAGQFHIHVSKVKYGPPDKSMFSLSHYGLGDADSPNMSSLGYPGGSGLILIIAGFGCLLTGLLVSAKLMKSTVQ